MKKTILLLSLGIIAIIYSTVYFLQRDAGMVFPKTPHGTLVQQPMLVTTGTQQVIQWIIPEKCAMNELEVQDVKYKSDSSLFWGGNTSSTCSQTENGYLCQAEILPEMKGRSGQWNIQVSSYQCTNGDYFVSKMTGV